MSMTGLTSEQAKKLLTEHGLNQLQAVAATSPFKLLLRQLEKNYLIYILFGAAVLSLVVGKGVTAYTIFGVVGVIVITSFIQEYRAERAIKALRGMILPFSTVMRDGKKRHVASTELVPGDIILLKDGERVPADAVVLEHKELKVDESILTGESQSVSKVVYSEKNDTAAESKLSMGTFIISGKCTARVTVTGMDTEYGKIASLITTTEKALPLQDKINVIAKYMTTMAVVTSVIMGAFLLYRAPDFGAETLLGILLVVIALLVSSIPEGFPVVLTTTLATGAHRMAKKNAIVNRMSIIETLGETTVVCSDKTGTITSGEMTVRHVHVDNKTIDVEGSGYTASGDFLYDGKPIDSQKEATLGLLIKSAALCNDASIEEELADEEFKMNGSPTESALLMLALKSNIDVEDYDASRVDEVPFNSDRKMMSVLCKEKAGHFVYAKGAVEVLLETCSHMIIDGKEVKVTEPAKNKLLEVNQQFNGEGLRTVALAYKKSESHDLLAQEKSLVFLGFVGMEDAPRPEVKDAIADCYAAGIGVKMITGDHKDTAVAIGAEVGIKGKVLTGSELDALNDADLKRVVQSVAIFARVKPEHKLRIVKALKDNGEIVTMTGDGVNDAPALKEAHIGVAMGQNGTDVSREVADLTLKDDNFATIVEAIREGRTIFNNIRKFITYQLSCNYAEIIIVFLATLVGLPLPLLAIHILFMNLVTDDLPAISLGFTPPDDDIMERKPRKQSNLLDRNMVGLLVLGGTIIIVSVLAVFYLALKRTGDIDIARTAAVVTSVCFQVAHAYNFRSLHKLVTQSSLFDNKLLVYASIMSILATLAIIYTPLNVPFETTPIGWRYWVNAGVMSLGIIVVFDLLKVARVLVSRRKDGRLAHDLG